MTDRPAVVAVIVPCHNEEQTVGAVVSGFLESIPDAIVVVADNASTDSTRAQALAAGARVIDEPRAGKGIAVRRLFADIDADCYVMVDGDATYDPSSAPAMVSLVLDGSIDMVSAVRVSPPDEVRAYRSGHRLGNATLTWIFNRLFDLPLTDTLTGYRAFSRRFVKSFPGVSEGFEIEAELNAHASVLGVPVAEVDSTYRSRPVGSESKLSTYRDGLRILRRNLVLFRDAKPRLSFTLLSLPWIVFTVLLLVPPVREFVETGVVLRFPSLIAGVGCFLVALNLWAAGLVLERVARGRTETVRLRYLAIEPPSRVSRTNADTA